MHLPQSTRPRPSLLPQLARCAHYRAEVATGSSDPRRHQLLAAFRALLAGHNVRVEPLDSADREAVRWAVEKVRSLAAGHDLETRESYLMIKALGLTGTADLLCSGGGWSVALKTGARQGFAEEQAAYALGFMDDHFTDAWTVHLLHCDLQEIETLRFTRDEAKRCLRTALARARGAEPPSINEYCNSCTQRFTCRARREALGLIPLEGSGAFALESCPSAQLREFILRAGVVEEFAAKAREILKTRCLAGAKIPGVWLAARRGSRRLPADQLTPLVETLGPAQVLSTLGTVSEARARELWIGSRTEAPFPAEAVQEMPGTARVHVRHP